MPVLTIRGIPVDFPKDPYPCQVQYMDKVIEALNNNQNALLESPTGTGKTLCLLCATLAWQKARNVTNPNIGKVEIYRSATSNRQISVSGGTNPSNSNFSIIIYATRTHSQLAQVVDELRSTNYRPRMSVLGSREQLCIHDKISKLKGSVLNHSCNSLVSRRGCMYKNNSENFIDTSNSKENDILDIEDLTKIGHTKKICPYFFARDYSTSAEIVFMPYNYLLDSSIRKTIKLPWENAIIVFDEAHNLERVASDAASFSINSTDIASCIQELQQVVQLMKDDYELKAKEKALTDKDGSNKSTSSLSAEVNTTAGVQKPTLQSCVYLLKAMFALEKTIDHIQLYPIESGQPPSSTLPGNWLVEAYQEAGFYNELHIEELKKCCNVLMDAAEEALNGVDDVLGGASAPSHATEPKLNLFIQTVERVIRSKSRTSIIDYKVYISEEEMKKSNKISVALQNAASKKRVLNYWCFSTGVALTELTALGIKSLLLTSGTLSPLEALKEDLKLPFPIELQNPHVINDTQVCVAAVSTGPTGKTLNSSFANRDNSTYKDELGNSILSIQKRLLEADNSSGSVSLTTKKSSAKGGVLVFFPSYSIMENTIERWKFSGIYDKLKSAIGYIIVEPKGSGSSVSTNDKTKAISSDKGKNPNSFMIGDSYRTTKKVQDAEEESFNSIVSEFDNAIARVGSCLLLAVCRGKVSEGIDFSNNKGRVVIVTGIPFAPFMDPWVRLKKQYLDEKASPGSVKSINASSSQSINAPNNPWLTAQQATALVQQQRMVSALSTKPTTNAVQFTGQMWYNQSASRAVNQCLGRVIRHCKDWGAIFLLDERFLQDRQVSQLSKWMRPIVRKHGAFSDSLKSFSSFLQNVTTDPGLYFEPKPVSVPTESNASIVRRAVSLANKKKYQDPFGRTIEISESQLDSGYSQSTDDSEGKTYIRKDLLSSQSSHHSSINSEISEFQDFMLTRQKQRSEKALVEATKVIEQETPKDLQSIIGKLKGRLSSDYGKLPLSQDRGFEHPIYVNFEDNDSNLSRNSKTVNLVDDEEDGPFSSIYSQQDHISQRQPSRSSEMGIYNSFTELSQPEQASSNNSLEKREGPFSAGHSKQKFGLMAAGSDKTSIFSQITNDSTQLLSQDEKKNSTSAAGNSARLFQLTQTLHEENKAMMTKSSSLKPPDLKAIFVTLQSYCHEYQVQEIKQLLYKWKEKKGIQFVSQIKDFQTSLVAILNKRYSNQGNKDILLSLEKIEEILKLFLNVIIPTTSFDDKTGISSSQRQTDEKTQTFLAEFYENGIKQQLAHILYLRKTESAASNNTQSMIGNKLSSKSIDLSKEKRPFSNSLLENTTVKTNQLKRKFIDVVGTEELGEKVGSNRAKRLVQLNNQREEQQSSSVLTTKTESSSSNDLFERIRNFSATAIAKPNASSKSTDPIKDNGKVANSKLQCCVCKELASVPCASRCGHICCQNCWVEWLSIKSICPMCREEVKKESITKIIVKAKN